MTRTIRTTPSVPPGKRLVFGVIGSLLVAILQHCDYAAAKRWLEHVFGADKQ